MMQSSGLTAEELKDLGIGVAEMVQRFGGFVAKYMGDGVLVYFAQQRINSIVADRVSGQDRGQSAFHESLSLVQMPSSIAVSRSDEEGRRRGM
jgi:hypothetical protein